MNTKLTLTIEQEIIQQAKEYAKLKNRSLSNIIENYLKVLITNNENKKTEMSSPIVSSLRGSFKAPNNFDYKEELRKRVEEKYL